MEEQFYLVWPLVFLGVMKLTRSLRVLLVVAVVGALASATEMALLYNPTNINRLYFGTDTHAQSVLVGATLAIGLRLWAESRRKGDELNWQARTPWARLVLTVIGVIGLAVSIVLYITVHSDDAFAYRGGFLIAALAASADPPQRLVRPVLAAGAAALVPSLHLHRADLLRHVPLAPSLCSSSSTSSGPA